MSILGTRVVRVEDPRLLTEGATYVDDLKAPELAGAAYVTFVRSPVAHARITSIDTSEALNVDGVVAVLTAGDLDDIPGPGGGPIGEPLLSGETVRYVGEPVAMVITDERYQGEDAAELVAVDYETLPAVIGIEAALRGDTLLFPGAGSNVVAGDGADRLDDAAFADCEAVVEAEIVNQRVAPAPLEVRGAAAAWTQDRLFLWASTQNAQMARDAVTGALGLERGVVRVITPDVGGGFGAKIATERDAIAVGWAARRLRRPMRWTESRSENLVAMTHGRAQRQRIKIGGTRDGRILAYRLDVVQDCGAYPRLGPLMPTLTLLMAGGVYDIAAVQTAYQAVVTNTAPIGAYRGAGRPEATAAIERAVDLFATEIGVDPAEVRRRNVVPPDRFPYSTPGGAVYDTGEYAKALDAVLDKAGYAELRAEQARRRERGDALQLGIGLSTYVEITAGDATDGETARLVVAGDGTATVYTGSSAHGQGHDTAFSMLVNERLGIPLDEITVIHGDTDAIPKAVGTFGSRSLQLGGAAVNKAAHEVRDRARELAAAHLEADAADVVLTDGRWHVRGVPGAGLGWGEVAGQAGPEGLVADVEFTAESPTFPFGAHLSVVEVDVETGKVRLVRHVTVDDAGVVLNPVLAEGQRHGGIAQGAAQALLEEMVYDPDGNPLTATLADYAFITAAELPSFELVDMATPTTINELGVKGIGEAGTIGATPAVQNAVVDALAHLGVRHIDMPTSPERVWNAINEGAVQ
jgi:aerobic carbon-monoxide dehydrogenase large subunit